MRSEGSRKGSTDPRTRPCDEGDRTVF